MKTFRNTIVARLVVFNIVRFSATDNWQLVTRSDCFVTRIESGE